MRNYQGTNGINSGLALILLSIRRRGDNSDDSFQFVNVLSTLVLHTSLAPAHDQNTPPCCSKRETVAPEKIARESVVPRGLSLRESVVVFYTNCVNPTGLGDHTFAVTLAYELYRTSQVPYPIVLLSGKDTGVGRLQTLCKTFEPEKYQLGNLPVRTFAIESFNSMLFTVQGYVELGCKLNSESYVKEVMQRDGGNAVFVGRPIEGSEFNSIMLDQEYPSLSSDRASTLTMGFGTSRDGVAYTPYSHIVSNVPSEMLEITKLPTNFVTIHRGYGLFCVSQGNSHPSDVAYCVDYLTLCDQRGTSNVVVALGNEKIITDAITQFAANTKKHVVLIDCINKKNEVDILTLQSDHFYVFMSRGFSQVQLSKLVENAGELVGFSSATLAIEGLGAGKLVFYRLIKDPSDIFLENYLAAVKIQCPNLILYQFAKLLFKRNGFQPEEFRILTQALAVSNWCEQLRAFNKALVESESKRLPVAVLNALNLPVNTSVTTQPRLFKSANDVRGINQAIDFLILIANDRDSHLDALKGLKNAIKDCSEGTIRQKTLAEIDKLIGVDGKPSSGHINDALIFLRDELTKGTSLNQASFDCLESLTTGKTKQAAVVS